MPQWYIKLLYIPMGGGQRHVKLLFVPGGESGVTYSLPPTHRALSAEQFEIHNHVLNIKCSELRSLALDCISYSITTCTLCHMHTLL